MITCAIHIEFLPDATEGCVLSVGIVPTPVEAHAIEEWGWHWIDMGLQAAMTRLKEQMAGFTKSVSMMHGDASEASRAVLAARMKSLGAGERIAATVRLGWSETGGLTYLLMAPVRLSPHPLEAGAWRTIKLALDIASDELNRDGFGMDYEEDERQLRELLEEKLGELPVFPAL